MDFLTRLGVYLIITLEGVHGKSIHKGVNGKTGGWNSIDIDQTEAMRQLVEYGYAGTPRIMSRKQAMARFPDTTTFINSLKDFQLTLGLPVTGVLDEETKGRMASPRCADPDVSVLEAAKKNVAVAEAGGGQGPGGPQNAEESGSVHYTTPYSKWSRVDAANLTWNVLAGWYDLPDISKADTDNLFRKQFKKWQAAANICFFHNEGAGKYESKIEIMFVPGNHRSFVSYRDWGFREGTGRTLGHSFFPYKGGIMDGDIHLDRADKWRLTGKGSSPEFDLGWTFLHELGHTIGLGHSNRKSAIMYPYYPSNDVNEPQLSTDDIAGAQALYGASTAACSSTTTDVTKTTSTTTAPGDCSIDAAFETDSSGSFTIKGTTITRYNGDYGSPSETATIRTALRPVDEAIVAAADDSHISSRKNYVFLMSNAHVWIYAVSDADTIASTFRRRPVKYTLSKAFKTTFKASAAFMDKCDIRIDGVKRGRRCMYVIVGTRFYQYEYDRAKVSNSDKLFRPVVNGAKVSKPSPMPLTDLKEHTAVRNLPNDWASTGIDAVAKLDAGLIFFKGQDYMKIDGHQEDHEGSHGSISTLLKCLEAADGQAQRASHNAGGTEPADAKLIRNKLPIGNHFGKITRGNKLGLPFGKYVKE